MSRAWVLLVAAAVVAVIAWTNAVTTGTVTRLDARNGYCGKYKVECTLFDTSVEYVVAGEVQRAVDQQWARGHHVPAEDAPFLVGDHPAVIYDPASPEIGMVLSAWTVGYVGLTVGLPLAFGALVLLGRRR